MKEMVRMDKKGQGTKEWIGWIGRINREVEFDLYPPDTMCETDE